MTTPLDPEHIVVTESVAGSDVPVELMYVEVWDGLYAPIGVRKPAGEGPYPIVLLASGNGGGGMAWVREAVANRGYIAIMRTGAVVEMGVESYSEDASFHIVVGKF